MSSDTLPITPTRFAAAVKDLSLSSLHLKVLELRNSIAHLDYSNEQLRPFADGTAMTLNSSTPSQPDPDCVDAIRENEQVIARMQERISLVRAEVEERGFSWVEFQSKEEAEAAAAAEGPEPGETAAAATATTNGVNGDGHRETNGQSNPWTDGTFQTGVIRGGEVHMDSVAGSRPTAGGSLTDEELRRRMEEQLRGLGEDEDGDGGRYL